MRPRRKLAAAANAAIALAIGAVMLGACGQAAPPPAADPPKRERLGLMSSLPITFALGADVAAIASGKAPLPWQRTALEQAYTLEPLDTLSPIPGLSPDAPETDPLAGLARIAIIQPRGLSPGDNAALDGWVRAGGRLLLVLDPALTGDYDLPLGDPRRPVDSVLIPPVVARWGLGVAFDDGQAAAVAERALGKAALPLALAGTVTIIDRAAADCTLLAGGAAARCGVGKGRVTLIADAALFEHPELAGEAGAHLIAVLAEALS